MAQFSDLNTKKNLPLAIIILSAVVLRIIYLIIYSSLPDWNLLTVDNYYHLNWANDIASGNIFGDTTYFRAPFYIYCLALLNFLFGSSIWIARIFGAFVGTGAIIVTYLIARKMFSERTAIIAAAIHLLFPIVLYFESEILLDTLFMFLLELSFYRYLIWRDDDTGRNLFWLSAVLGLSSIARPVSLIFAPILLLMVLFQKQNINRRFVHSVILVGGLFLLILPITIRNMAVGGEPVLIAAQGGINFYIGNNQKADGLSASMPEPLGHNWKIEDITYIAEKDVGRKLKPGEVSAYWYDKTIGEILDNPVATVKLYIKKLYFNISNREISNNRNIPDFVSRHLLLKFNPLSFYLIFGLALFAMVSGWKSHNGIRQMAITIAVYILAVSLYFFNSRFRVPILPFYFILAATAVESLFYKFKSSGKSIILPGIVAIGAGIFSFLPVVPLPQGVSTQHLLSNGLRHYELGEISEALKLFYEAAEIDSTFPETNLNIGACYLRLGMDALDSAVYYFEKENRLHPERTLAYGNLASVELLQGKYLDAIEEADKAINYKPYRAMPHLVKLKAAAEINEIDTTSFYEMATKSIEQTNQNPEIANLAAIIVTNRGCTQKAKDLLSIAMVAQPTPIEINDDAFSADFYDKQTEFVHEKARAHYQMGFILGIEGDFRQSITYSGKAIELDSTLSEAYQNLSNGYRSTGQFDKADSVIALWHKKFPGQ